MSLFGTRRPTGLPNEGRLADFDGATGWLNSEPLTPEGLRGKVVFVDFWTYTCINWLRTLGYVRAWAEKYAADGLVVVGVHTPEFPFERDVDNIREAIAAMGIAYPVAIDSDYAVWNAFANRYWPAAYIADSEGVIRHHQFGEGGYTECERVIQELLREAGRDEFDDGLVDVPDEGFEAQADWAHLESPETYLGYGQTRGFASPGGAKHDEASTFELPGSLELNQWALAGDWTVEQGPSVLDGAEGTLAFRFHARDVNLVMGPRPKGGSVPFEVRLDGEPPGDAHGLDVDESGRGTLAQQRLYQLLRIPEPVADRTVEITFQAPGAEAYCFTFG